MTEGPIPQKWREVPSMPGMFVTKTGEVASVTKGKFTERKLSVDSTGYLCVSRFGKKRHVHRLVAETFLRKTAATVNHKDCDKTSNSVENLEWVSHAANNKHAWDVGVKKKRKRPIVGVGVYEGVFFRSLSDCSRAGFNQGNVQRAIATGIRSSGYYWYDYKELMSGN